MTQRSQLPASASCTSHFSRSRALVHSRLLIADRSSSSTGCATPIGSRAARRPAPICIRQPGLPVATTSGRGVGGGEARDLAVEHRAGHGGAEHGVDARAAAALVGAGQQPEPKAGDGARARRAAPSWTRWACWRWQGAS